MSPLAAAAMRNLRCTLCVSLYYHANMGTAHFLRIDIVV